ncbi:MAG: hypothetical protein ACOX1T_07360 [Saccharofermentanales bacterium]
MARSSREYTRIRKRIFVVAGITLSVVALVAFLLSWLLSTLVGPANMYRYRISEALGRPPVLGSGLSVAELPSANFLRDASFEPFLFQHEVDLLGGSANILYAEAREASAGQFGDGFFNGAAIRVVAADSDGLNVRHKGTIANFGMNRVGTFQLLSIPADVQPGSEVLSFARNGIQSLAVGRGGMVLRDVTGQTMTAVDSGITADLTGICAFDTGFLIVSEAGDAAFSADGLSWEPWFVMNPAALNAVAANAEGSAVAVGPGGVILYGRNGVFSQVQSGTDRDLNGIAYGDGYFIAAGDGVLLKSTNGFQWENTSGGTMRSEAKVNWKSVSYQEEMFIAAGSQGSMAFGKPDALAYRTVDAATTFTDAVALSGREFILLDQAGGFTVSNDGGLSWRKSGINTGMTSNLIERISNDRILSADAAGHLGQANIVAEIELSSPLGGAPLQQGDMCFLELYSNTLPTNYIGPGAKAAAENMPWQVEGGEAVRVTQETTSAGGKAALRLQAGGSGNSAETVDCYISQTLNNQRLLSQSRTQVYRLEMYMRQEQIATRSAAAWLSGPFTTISTRFENVGSNYKKYSFTFVLPAETIRENTEIKLNIGFNGSGVLWLDRIYLGPAIDQYHGLDRSFAEFVEAAAPRFLRLAYTGLGSKQVAADAFALQAANSNPTIDAQGFHDSGVRSLETGLQLCLTANADPCLALGSYLDQTSMQNLLEYLAGPVSEPYGQLRLANERIAPYTDAFSRVILEFSDEDNLFTTDQQRASYVNLMIRTIEQSAYYRDLKSRLIYVDGMDYENGVLLSRADYHASDFELEAGTTTDSAQLKQLLSAAFNDYFDRIPRTPERTDESYPEVMRRASLSNGSEAGGYRLADLCEVLLQDLGRYTTLSFLDYPSMVKDAQRQLYSSAAGIVSRTAQGAPLNISYIAEQINEAKSEDTTTDEPAGTSESAAGGNAPAEISIYAFRDNDRVSVAIINASSEPVILELTTDLALLPAVIEKYDETGRLLSSQPYRRLNSRINLLPGSVALINSSD